MCSMMKPKYYEGTQDSSKSSFGLVKITKRREKITKMCTTLICLKINKFCNVFVVVVGEKSRCVKT